jgi:hypothetical protein
MDLSFVTDHTGQEPRRQAPKEAARHGCEELVRTPGRLFSSEHPPER